MQEELKTISGALRETCEKMINNCIYCSYSGSAQCKKMISSKKENPSNESNDGNKC